MKAASTGTMVTGFGPARTRSLASARKTLPAPQLELLKLYDVVAEHADVKPTRERTETLVTRVGESREPFVRLNVNGTGQALRQSLHNVREGDVRDLDRRAYDEVRVNIELGQFTISHPSAGESNGPFPLPRDFSYTALLGLNVPTMPIHPVDVSLLPADLRAQTATELLAGTVAEHYLTTALRGPVDLGPIRSKPGAGVANLVDDSGVLAALSDANGGQHGTHATVLLDPNAKQFYTMSGELGVGPYPLPAALSTPAALKAIGFRRYQSETFAGVSREKADRPAPAREPHAKSSLVAARAGHAKVLSKADRAFVADLEDKGLPALLELHGTLWKRAEGKGEAAYDTARRRMSLVHEAVAQQVMDMPRADFNAVVESRATPFAQLLGMREALDAKLRAEGRADDETLFSRRDWIDQSIIQRGPRGGE